MSDSGSGDRPSYHPHPSRPRFTVPPAACDTHFHVFGNDPREKRNPQVPPRAPKRAPWDALHAMHRALGIERGVLVQNTVVQINYDVLLDDLAANPRVKAIALISDQTSDRDLERLDRGGVCGIRFHFARYMQHHQSSWEVFKRSVDRVRPLNWHVDLHVEPHDIIEYGAMLRALPVPVVIDHMANVRYGGGIDQPGFRALLELQKADNIWIKIGNSDRWSAAGPPRYGDAVPFGRAVVDNGAERLIWCSDWPHALYKTPQDTTDWPPPDDGDLLNLLEDFAPDPSVRQKILVDNPNRLYRFAG
jgi:predicted TIM-barrel fold metal-dependent hydrolase